MKKQIIYTFELGKSQTEAIKLICGDPWSFQDQDSANKLFTEYLCNLWNKNINKTLVKPYMAKGLLVTNDNSVYIKYSMLPDKIDLKDYIILI